MELSDYSSKKVVFVDDDFVTGHLMERILQKRGLNIDVFKSGEELITYLRDNKPDLVLLDILMPGVSGLGVLKFIREKYKPMELPVVMLSAESNSKKIVEAIKLGANDYITKPMNPDVAVARIKAQLQFINFYRDSLRKQELETLNSIIVTYNHEINNPLFVAMGNLPEDVSRLSNKKLERVRKSLSRIADITSAIRQLTLKTKSKSEFNEIASIKLSEDSDYDS